MENKTKVNSLTHWGRVSCRWKRWVQTRHWSRRWSRWWRWWCHRWWAGYWTGCSYAQTITGWNLPTTTEPKKKTFHVLEIEPRWFQSRPGLSTCLPPPALPQQVVNGGGASVDAPQHVSGASLQVPAQRQTMQVGKQTHLKCGGRGTIMWLHTLLTPLLTEIMSNVSKVNLNFAFLHWQMILQLQRNDSV